MSDVPTSALTSDDLDLLRKEFDASPTHRIVQNALTNAALSDVALDRGIVTRTDTSMSHRLDDWKVTNQEKSGRCWLFAGLNLLRVGAARRMGLKDFEFSQNHLLFWDKLERCNYFMDSVVRLRDRPADDRTLGFVLDEVMGDGGQWNMFVALVHKHGLVPKSAMPETRSSSETGPMNGVLRSLLRQAARDLRAAKTKDVEGVRAQVMSTAYRILAMHLGTPPESVEWQWTDTDKQFHRDGVLTPQEFRDRYVEQDLGDYVCLVDDPRESSPRGATFTVDELGNVVGGVPVRYLNVEPDLLKSIAAASIRDGEPVWFGCDVGKMMAGDRGIWDARLYDYDGIYDTSFALDKAGRLEFHDTLMTHAMLLTGVDLDGDTPRKWRVENSWGDSKADQGFYTMNDSWFAPYVFEIAAHKSRLPQELQDALQQEPIVLPAWDPMGALANG
ncbi:aminopeptidase C [Allobranchiibius sp. CTAmp26]|uniref:aminopeptidase C n=1 Tax=Allobranchiibius sp. CTAmp26 TaxID=2815214 RepID=UPI001AA10C78|nr:C1 family peptidase [Allobranchiibius sp. CTAmp26]MBO1755616.1 C1 family peptidase [Allobranchiibius sp. CTAmp26]